VKCIKAVIINSIIYEIEIIKKEKDLFAYDFIQVSNQSNNEKKK
jgi:hypothetical protein